MYTRFKRSSARKCSISAFGADRDWEISFRVSEAASIIVAGHFIRRRLDPHPFYPLGLLKCKSYSDHAAIYTWVVLHSSWLSAYRSNLTYKFECDMYNLCAAWAEHLLSSSIRFVSKSGTVIVWRCTVLCFALRWGAWMRVAVRVAMLMLMDFVASLHLSFDLILLWQGSLLSRSVPRN